MAADKIQEDLLVCALCFAFIKISIFLLHDMLYFTYNNGVDIRYEYENIYG